MKNKILLFSIIGLLSSCETEDKVYNPQYGEGYYILTPKVSNKPRINGPEVYGVRPKHEFMYSIPVTGQRPMEIFVTGCLRGFRMTWKKILYQVF